LLLANRVAIITGGAVGIGKGIAEKFADEGCAVVISDISESAGQKTADEISKMGRPALFVRCDVKEKSQVQAMVSKTIDKFGKVDVLVNNAGGVAGSKGGSGLIENGDYNPC
jgi:NAD(P)-dependent dehydrogenase (short-subunit alcohol dehydrogenase family)